MIEFRGTLSKKATNFLSLKTTQMGFVMISVTFAVVLIVILWLCFLLNYWHILMGYTFVYIITLFSGFLIWNSPKNKKASAPNKIIINDGEITSYTLKNKSIQQCDDVKYVLDYGDWYYLEFVMGKKSVQFLCEKDLICNGTIEEFEELFKNKIIRKYQE